ncbi:hypothetical protein PHSY_005414 [Pseudozyma hubeiensis SY62]|uniref:Uncharacterized protein n=1 Tax=Pseudozyma hubeiensis (strain SY62) TaxID=1305764 RepID=R9P902_PSEHS|nr:hypothetical protein PHSY_005414 [Pseudozyma hubeiensis SY62]GAC97826.1 hypothetical protein PHSY_005414 [Pseudozyma hubeiensis SY62]
MARQQSFQGRPTGVKGFSKVVIGKGGILRPSTRDGSAGTPSPMSFAAGPRASNRASNALEFGGGVVPDDSDSDADLSDSSMSPVTPQYLTNTSRKQPETSTAAVSSVENAAFLSNSQAHDARQKSIVAHARLGSIDLAGGFEDFRSLIAFPSSPNLLKESPALTASPTLSTPDFAATVASTSNTDKATIPYSLAEKPQPPIPTSSLSTAKPRLLSSADIATTNIIKAVRTPSKKASHKTHQISAEEFAAVGRSLDSARRTSNASSVPESVSQCGSSQLACEEFRPPARDAAATGSMRSLEGGETRDSETTPTWGLGISSVGEQGPAAPSSTDRVTHAALRRSNSTHRHIRTGSELSGHSSADSWGRGPPARDSFRMFFDADKIGDLHKTASSSSSKTQRTYVSDSGHSTATAETSTDMHDLDQLSPIKERTESPESTRHRRKPSNSGSDRSSQAASFGMRNTGTLAASAVSGRSPIASPQPSQARVRDRLPSLSEAREAGKTHERSGAHSPLQSAINDLESPRSFSHRTSSTRSATLDGLLPPLELDSPLLKAHTRSASNSSWTYARKFSSQQYAVNESRRGSADAVSPTNTSRLPSGIYTTPLPSAPFPPAKAQASVPTTPNLAYDAALSKATGKQRKNRPAALALDHAALSAFAPNGAGPSPTNINFKGLASPGRLRAPPPSAPPCEPLPPIPNTPSLVPKSPGLRLRTGSWATPLASEPADAVDATLSLVTPTQTRSSSFSREAQMQEYPSKARKPSDLSLLSSRAGAQPPLVSESATQSDSAAPIKNKAHDADRHRLAVTSAAGKGSIRSPTVASTDEGLDSIATVTVAQTATRASSQPMRWSSNKKGTNAPETNKSAAPLVVAIEHADGQIVSPVIKPIDLQEAGQVNAAHIDTQTPPSSAVLNHVLDPDNTPQLGTSRPSQPAIHRASAADKAVRPPPSAWNSRSIASTALRDSAPSESKSSDVGHDGYDESRAGAGSVASCHSTTSNISDRRHEILQDREALLGALSESSRKEIIKRTEGRFAGAFGEVARAFRQLQADKEQLEQMLRKKTTLDGSGTNKEVQSISVSTLTAKLDHSNAEIRKLLDLLEQQREVMEQMMATHQLQRETYDEDLSHLNQALDEAQDEAEHHRAQVVKLNAELAKAHASMVQANAEAMRARASLAEESRKRENAVALLRQAKERLKEVETEQQQQSQQRFRQDSEGVESLSDDSPRVSTLLRDPSDTHPPSSSESEVAQLRRMLAERDAEISSLRLSHTDSLLQNHQLADDSHSTSHGSALHDDPSEQVDRLRTQLLEQRERERHIRSAYLHVRDELRKVNDERRRSSTASLGTPTSASGVAAMDGPSSIARASWNAAARPTTSAAAAMGARYQAFMAGAGEEVGGEEPRSAVQFKRLSLPIVARASGIVVAAGTAGGSDAGHEEHDRWTKRRLLTEDRS